MADKKLSIVLELIDKATGELKKVSRSFDDFSKKASDLGKSMTVMGGAITGAMALSVKSFFDQEEAITKLETITRQATGATEEQIQALKDQASALQKVGVIGDEVTMAGQAQLATFGLQTESIEKLTSGMLDLAVNNKGVNATQEDLQNIANMVGKVMEGQVGALTRVGVSFSEAQAEILKFGTEEEKASVLAEVLQQNVGGVNEAMAQTSQGALKQFTNNFGDLQERIGEVVATALIPFIQTINDIVIKIQEWQQANPELFSKIILIIGAIGALMVTIGPLLIVLPSIITSIQILAGVFALVISPVGLIVLAIGALIATLAYLIWNWQAVKEHFLNLGWVQTLTSTLGKAWDWIKTAFDNTVNFLIDTWNWTWETTLSILKIALETMFIVMTGGFGALIIWGLNNKEKLLNAFAKVWTIVKDTALGAFENIKAGVKTLINYIISKLNSLIGGINNITSKIPGFNLTIPMIPAFANGGIVTKPTVGLIGEAGAEAVIPLNKINNFGGTTININWTGAVDETSAEMVAQKIADTLNLNGRTSLAL